MNWITINKEKCNGCGICVLRCPQCFSKEKDEISVQADKETCSLCGHCIALCRKDAITHSEMDMSNFIETDPEVNFKPDDFLNFLRSRRSHRDFKKKDIPQQVMDQLIDICRYSPTGGNMQNVQVIVVRDKEIIQKLSDITVDIFEQWGNAAKKETDRLRNEGREPDEMQLRIAMYGERLSQARKEGMNPIFYNAPAVMIFHSLKGGKSDCMIAATTVSLYARTLGIESTYNGLFEGASKENKQIYEILNLPSENEIGSVIFMGYPKLKFLRTVDRKPVKVIWM